MVASIPIRAIKRVISFMAAVQINTDASELCEKELGRRQKL